MNESVLDLESVRGGRIGSEGNGVFVFGLVFDWDGAPPRGRWRSEFAKEERGLTGKDG
jgi:hypothetical protein